MQRVEALHLRRPAEVVRWLEVYGALVAAALAAVLLWHAWDFYHDDAFVTLRYAQRILDGKGPTWTDGERVEGFTHPLWLAQIAVLGRAGVNLRTASRALGLFYLLALGLVWRRAGAAPLTLMLIASQPGLILWTLGGLETISFAFWLTFSCWAAWQTLQRESSSPHAVACAAFTGFGLAAAALTRPEGVAAAGIGVAWIAYRGRWRAALVSGVIVATAVGGYELARFGYYGDLLPNTAYAKVGGFSTATRIAGGLRYLWSTSAEWSPLAVFVCIALVRAGKPRPFGMLLIAFPVIASLVAAGGDHMPGARLLVPALVVLVFAAGIAPRQEWQRDPMVVALATFIVVLNVAYQLTAPIAIDRAARIGEPVGRFLEANLPSGSLVATATAGSTPYNAPSLRFIDTLGLNDRHIACRKLDHIETRWQSTPGHLKGDGAYVLDRNPDVIILGPAQGYTGENARAWFLTDFELLGSERFRADYRPYRFDVASAGQRVGATMFLRRGSAAERALSAKGTPVATRALAVTAQAH